MTKCERLIDRGPLQITPSMVREAYALLRQSIIHVEQDDIDFEDDAEVDELVENLIDGAGGDVEMNGSEVIGSAEPENNASAPQPGHTPGEQAIESQAIVPGETSGPTKKKLRISCKSDRLPAERRSVR